MVQSTTGDVFADHQSLSVIGVYVNYNGESCELAQCRTTRIRCPIRTVATTAAANKIVSIFIGSPFTGSAIATITNGCNSMICPTRAMPPIASAALNTKNAVY